MNERNEALEQVIALYVGGASLSETARATSKSIATVWRWLRDSGIDIRQRGAHSRGKPWTEARRARNPAKPPRDPDAPRDREIIVRRAIGNKSIDKRGYIVVNLGRRRRQYEHVLIAEKALGRRLKRGEVVHHINCNRSDNRPQNLLICTVAYHVALHARMRRHPYWKEFDPLKLKAA